MAGQANELAPHHLPVFVPSADGSDPLMTIMLVALIIGAVLLGTFYLHLHSLPERLAHKHGRMQFELVAILGLLALFTHNSVFWVAALLLAFVQIPDLLTPLESIAASAGRIANRNEAEDAADPGSPDDPRSPDGNQSLVAEEPAGEPQSVSSAAQGQTAERTEG